MKKRVVYGLAFLSVLSLFGCDNKKTKVEKTSNKTTIIKTTTNKTTTSGNNAANNVFYIFDIIGLSFNVDSDPKEIVAKKIQYDGEEYIVDIPSTSETYYSAFEAAFTCDLDKHEIKLIYRVNRVGQNWDYCNGSVSECKPGWFDSETYVLKITQNWDNIISYELYEPYKVSEKVF